MENQFWSWAVILGALSAASLPLGSILAFIWRPGNKLIGLFTAFGGGALIAALTIELVAPTTHHLLNTDSVVSRGDATRYVINMLVGAVIGGILFIGLDQLINSKGGFLRKTSATISYFTRRKSFRRRQLVAHLGASELVRHLPLSMLDRMVNNVFERNISTGDVLFSEGEPGDIVYFIESGTVAISRGIDSITVLSSGDVLGEISAVTGARRTATAIAESDSSLLAIWKDDFDHLRRLSPQFNQMTQNLAANRLQELANRNSSDSEMNVWVKAATAALTDVHVVPSDDELQKVSEEHSGAPMAIWLGILLDGIPESFVIGSALAVSITLAMSQSGADSVVFGSVIPYTLIAGLFLANFPESMSSSIGMLKQGWGRLRVFMMWFSLMILTSLGAGLGYWLGGNVGHDVVVFIEGLAAGAMLTMIAAAMIPEAVHLGGSSITGLGTLMGFLSAVAFKLLE